MEKLAWEYEGADTVAPYSPMPNDEVRWDSKAANAFDREEGRSQYSSNCAQINFPAAMPLAQVNRKRMMAPGSWGEAQCVRWEQRCLLLSCRRCRSLPCLTLASPSVLCLPRLVVSCDPGACVEQGTR